MRVLLVGSSGFIGREIARQIPASYALTGTYNSEMPENFEHELERLNILSDQLDWEEKIREYDCVIISARANSNNEKSRTDLSIRASKSFQKLIDSISKHADKKYVLVVNGSLSYGHRGEELVKSEDEVNPVGFAKSYSIAEKPFRDYELAGGKIGILRAPWVIGEGSWFTQMYLQPEEIPIISKGEQWMSILSVKELAKCVWDAVSEQKIGVIHPKLTYRCRQKEFAKIVSEVKNKPLKKVSRLKMIGWEKQMRESIMASIRLDDGYDIESESDESRANLFAYLESI